jgi:predicted PurR-regulated permease PerM
MLASMPEPAARPEEGSGASAGLKEPDRPAGPEGSETYRGRMFDAAAARGIPLPTILVSALVATVTLVVVGMTLTLLWVLRTVLLYLVASGFIALLLSPPVRFLERRGLARGWATALVFLIAVVVFAGIVYLFTAPLVTAIGNFSNHLPRLIQDAEHGRGALGRFLRRVHAQNWVQKNLPHLRNTITKDLKPAQALSVGAAAFSTVVAITTIAILAVFELLEAPKMRATVLSMMRPERRARVERVYEQTVHSVTGYMLGNATTSAIAGVVVFITLEILGVPFAPLLGLFVALVDLLPLVGGLLAGVPVVLVALVHSVPAGIVMAVIFLAYQQIENHILNPAIMSKTVRLNPLWVLLAVLVGATLGERIGAGLGAFIGALVGIPVGGAIQILVLEIRRGPGAPEPQDPGPEPELPGAGP